MAEKKLFLLDAFALIFRAYYAFINRPIRNSKGVNTSATYGFTTTLFDLLNKEQPSHIAVVFDSADETTERAQEFSFYKANRDKTPEDISNAIPYIKQIIEAFNIPILEKPGYEADDIIGTVAKEKEKDGFTVYMVTPDKDYAQLVSDNIYMYKPSRQGKGIEILGVPEILEQWNIDRPEQVIDILGLWGDAVDNIPGVPGIGEKTAKKLVKEYGSMEKLIENSDQLKGKMKENLENHVEQALISKQLATIILDVPVEVSNEDLKITESDKKRLEELFAELEFRTLGKRILGDDFNVVNASSEPDLFSQAITNTPGEEKKPKDTSNKQYKLIEKESDRKKLIKDILKQKEVCFDTETTGIDANNCELVGLAFSWEQNSGYYVPISADQEKAKEEIELFRPFFEDSKIVKIAHNLKYDLLVLKWYGIEVSGPVYDTLIAHYALKPGSKNAMDILSESYLNYSPTPIEDLIGKKGKNQGSMRDVPLDQLTDYAAEDADVTLQLKGIFEPMLDKEEVRPLYEKVEMPLVPVLADMEFEGVGIDTEFLKSFSVELESSALSFREKIYETAGVEFNLNSPKQLGQVLFDQMEIPYTGKKTKTGQYSTNEEILSQLAEEHEIAKDILSYREVTKLRSTYVDALPNMINPKTGRIHSSFRQAVVPTGRLSSDNPNLQNIPIRTDKGRKVRTAFIPKNEDYLILSADYSQVELRIIADLSSDDNMIKAFIDGEDIHSATASKVFGVSLDEVNREMRRKAKAVNFGLAYGQSAFGLSQTLGISRTEAKEIIENYFEKYPGIKDYMEQSVEFAKKTGYAKTLMGRKRALPDIHSANRTVRSFAERNAINTPIQGSAADLVKLAMINVHNAIQEQNLKSTMILQVHDELVFEVHKDELEDIKPLIEKNMSEAIELKVPLIVDMGWGQNWLEAH